MGRGSLAASHTSQSSHPTTPGATLSHSTTTTALARPTARAVPPHTPPRHTSHTPCTCKLTAQPANYEPTHSHSTTVTATRTASCFITHARPARPPPHSANASYTLTFPTTAGTNGYALTTNGSGTLAWSDVSSAVTVDGGNFANGSSLVSTSSTIDGGAF